MRLAGKSLHEKKEGEHTGGNGPADARWLSSHENRT